MKCEVCGIEQVNCHPGGQWYDQCPFDPSGGPHRWDNKPWFILALDADMKTDLLGPFPNKVLAEAGGRILLEEDRYAAFQVQQPTMPPYA